MNDKLYGAWLMDLAAYFINKHKYQMITLSKANDEIWLVNPLVKVSPLILITTTRTDDFDDESILKQRETLAVLFQTSHRGVNISVNESSERFDDHNVGVSYGFVSPSKIIDYFGELDSLLRVSKNTEIAMAKSLINLKRTLAKSQGLRAKPMYGTYVLSALIVVSYLLSLFFLSKINSLEMAYIALGSFYKPLVVQGLEVFRFITSAFVTTDIFEVILSIMVLRNTGNLIERQIGWAKYLGIFFSGIIFGNIMLFITNDAPLGAGIVTGLCSLLGFIIVLMFEVRAYRNQRFLSQIITLSFICMLYISMPTVSNSGLLGSLFLGVLLGFLGTKRADWENIRKALKIAVPLFVVGMVGIALTKTQFEFNESVHQALISVYDYFNIDWYANHLRTFLK